MYAKVIQLEDILYVFERWTIMLKSDDALCVGLGKEIDLLDQDRRVIGKATVSKFLSSRNVHIVPAEISSVVDPDDFKDVKFIALED